MRAIALAILTWATAWATLRMLRDWDNADIAASVAWVAILLFIATIACIIAGV